MKTIELVNILQRLNKLKESDITLPVQVSYAVLKNIDRLGTELKAFETARNDIIRKYAADGKIDSANPHYAECLRDMAELGDTEGDYEFYKISYGKIADLTIPADVMTALYPLIEEE